MRFSLGAVLLFVSACLVVITTLLMSVYQKSLVCKNLYAKHQQSSLQYHHSFDINAEVLDQ